MLIRSVHETSKGWKVGDALWRTYPDAMNDVLDRASAARVKFSKPCKVIVYNMNGDIINELGDKEPLPKEEE